MSKIFLSTFKDKEYFKGNVEMVSHGIEELYGSNVILSVEPLAYYIDECGAKYDEYVDMYYLEDK